MRTTIDKAGRLVIPRALRGQVGLARGGEVELEVDGAAIRIEPVVGHDLAEEAGFLVIPSTGVAFDDMAVQEFRRTDQR